MEKFRIGTGMKGHEKSEYKFAFNPYPLLPLSGKAEDGISGYFTKKDLPMLLAKYGSDVFEKVEYSHEIGTDYGRYPFFCILKDPMRRTFTLASQLLQIQLFEMNDWYYQQKRKERMYEDEKPFMVKKLK